MAPKRPEVIHAFARDSLAGDEVLDEVIFVDRPGDLVTLNFSVFGKFGCPAPHLEDSIRWHEAMKPHVCLDPFGGVRQVERSLNVTIFRTRHEYLCSVEGGNGNNEVGSSGVAARLGRRPDIGAHPVPSFESCHRVQDVLSNSQDLWLRHEVAQYEWTRGLEG